ncbi:MAG: Hpt domain-containing protein [Parvularculaceae bacterium]|nr:MAG: Hpt domain-containing protein [Parvularculaceae bacterium]
MSDATIDISHLQKYTAGDAALLDEILGIFVEHAASCVVRLRVDMPDEAWKDVCHSLKGAARGVGAWALGDAADQSEGLVSSLPDYERAREKALKSIRQSARDAVEFAENLRRKVGAA